MSSQGKSRALAQQSTSNAGRKLQRQGGTTEQPKERARQPRHETPSAQPRQSTARGQPEHWQSMGAHRAQMKQSRKGHSRAAKAKQADPRHSQSKGRDHGQRRRITISHRKNSKGQAQSAIQASSQGTSRALAQHSISPAGRKLQRKGRATKQPR